jgi:hypothetical protein
VAAIWGIGDGKLSRVTTYAPGQHCQAGALVEMLSPFAGRRQGLPEQGPAERVTELGP